MSEAKLVLRIARDQVGTALVEFSVLLPVLFVIMWAILDFGMIFLLQNEIVNAAREAARVQAVGTDTPATANQLACNYLPAAQTFTISTTYTCPGFPFPNPAPTGATGDVTVTISTSASAASVAVVNYLSMFTGQTLSASVTMRTNLACTGSTATTTLNCTP